MSREAGSPDELIAGHMDRGRSQRAAGEVAAVFFIRLTISTQEKPDLPLVFLPCICCIFSAFQWDKKGPSLQELNSVFNIIMTAIKAVNITQNQREKRRTSLEKCGERAPTLHFFLPSQEVTATHSFLP